MERKVKEAVRKAIGKTLEFGSLKIMTTFRMLFLAGMVFVLRASCTYASGIYINVNVMKETASGLLVGEGSMALAILAGCIHFLALGCIWRVVCEWGYRLIKRLCDE